MSDMTMISPVELIPAEQQRLWGWPAAANFALGGLGAGFYVVAALASGLEPSPALTLATWLGPILVLAGFAAVAGEAGRPFRGPRVLFRVRTSWMSRELWIGGVFVLFAAADVLFPLRLHRAQAVVAALLLAVAQGFILRRSRGVTAWDVSLMPWLFLASALLSGGGLYLIVASALGHGPAAGLVAALLVLLAAGWALWSRYLTWSQAPAFVAVVKPLHEGVGGRSVVLAGYLAPFLLALSALAVPWLAPPAFALAGALMVAGQFLAKTILILKAGQLRPITLAGLALRRRSS
ncbi:MAG TPA: hypothetical protein VFN71_14975 [Methylomirabilota bacterium]|nr:hypothetical protein [Methylomirabilota bacterium]